MGGAWFSTSLNLPPVPSAGGKTTPRCACWMRWWMALTSSLATESVLLAPCRGARVFVISQFSQQQQQQQKEQKEQKEQCGITYHAYHAWPLAAEDVNEAASGRGKASGGFLQRKAGSREGKTLQGPSPVRCTYLQRLGTLLLLLDAAALLGQTLSVVVVFAIIKVVHLNLGVGSQAGGQGGRKR